MGFLGLSYRRPAAQPVGSAHSQKNPESLSEQPMPIAQSFSFAGIPDALSFDSIINGGTCPPCTVRDFLNYLTYIEHSAENLQFFLWYKNYTSRFHASTTADMALAPEWTQEMQDETFDKLQKEHRDGLRRDPVGVAAVFKGTDFEKRGNTTSKVLDRPSPIFSENGSNPFRTPPRTPQGQDGGILSSGSFASFGLSAVGYHSQASEAFAAAGIKAPFTVQPFREEIDRVIATYIMNDSPRQLNLSARERMQLLTALSRTTHPTAFRQVVYSIESTLRLQAHPDFIRWSIRNGNSARVTFANVLGTFLIVGSLLAYILLCLGSVPRGLRAVPAVGMFLGVSTLVAALKGMCVVLHGMHHRQVRPWELFADEEVELRDEKRSSVESLDACGSSNSYEDEPWVVKYQKRNLVRRIFDREAWIQEPALRSIQDTIFIQAVLIAMITTGGLTALFVSVPGGHFF